MKFCYHENAGLELLEIRDEQFRHLYLARRTHKNENLNFCNLKENKIYTYTHLEINKKSAKLKCINSQEYITKNTNTHLIWAITEAKNIYNTLPFLNQLNVQKLTLFYAQRSQRNEKINLEKLEKILIQSCEQCGRNSLMQIEILKDFTQIMACYPDAYMLDFGGQTISQNHNLANGIIIGPEGGFSNQEREGFDKKLSFGELILKSECAAIAIATLGSIY